MSVSFESAKPAKRNIKKYIKTSKAKQDSKVSLVYTGFFFYVTEFSL